MKADTLLDCAVFKLSPKHTRCELLAYAGNETEKLASGLLKPFITHLGAAEDQVTRGDHGHLIKLEVPSHQDVAPSWFTKGTLERFVRFVSTPEVLEHIYIVDAEMSQLDQARNFQLALYSQGGSGQVSIVCSGKDGSRVGAPLKSRSGIEETDASQRELLRAIDVRLMALQQEISLAFARAVAAGFAIEHMADLMIFAEQFGATRLRDACTKFMALCQKRQGAYTTVGLQDTTSPSSNMSTESQPHANFPPFPSSKNYEVTDVEAKGRDVARRNEDPGLVSSGITLERSLESTLPEFAVATSYRASGLALSSSDEKQVNQVCLTPLQSQRDQAVDKLSDFRSVFSGQHESGSSYSVGISNRKINYTGTSEKSSVTDNSLVKPDALSRFDNLSTEARPESINIASIEFEQLGSDSANQSQADRNRHLVRSPHRRRSSSPTRQVQNGRTGSRRSNSVVIKSINYSQDWPNKDTCSNRELRSSDSDGAESDHAGNDPLESAQKPECTRRLSVQDAIHLFERKQNEMRRLGGEGIRKLGKVENRRFSSETGNSNEKLFLRRWSGASDTGMRISALKEATDDSQNQSTFVPSSGSKSEMKTSLSQSIGQSSQTVVDQGSIEETPQSEFRPLANSNQGVEEKKDAGLTPLDHHNHKTDGLYLSSCNAQMPSTDQHLMPVVVQMNNARVSKKELTQTSFQKLQTATFPVRQESKASYVSSHMRSRSSGCEPVTTFSLKTTQPKSSNKWREELGEKANQLEALFAAHKLRNQSQKAGNQEKMHVVQKEMSIGVGPDNLLTMPVQNIGRESLGSSWTNGVDSDMQALMNMIDVNHVNNCCKEELLCFVNDQEFRGKLYDQYNEKRDAKLRDEHTTKRAEKEAKIKAMQDVLEQRQVEMAATIATKNDPLGCSEDMPKDLPKPNGSRKFSSKTMPARSSLALTSSSPRTVLPGKVSSSTNISSSSRCRSQPENPLAQSVPNFTDLKKENTKPSLGKGTSNSSVLGKGPKSQGGLKNNTKTVAGREPFLDTATAGFGSIARIAKSKEEKKCLSQAALRKSTYAPLMGEVNAKVQKGTALEPNICSKLTNKSSPAPLEAKPFLRKGSGIGPGAGPGIAKLKQFLAAEDGVKSAEESQVNDQNVGETVEELVNISQLPCTHEGAEAEAAEAAEENERYKLSSDDTERSDNQDDSETSQIDMQGDLASASVSPFEMPSSPVATNNGYSECNGTMACSAGPSMTATPSSCCITSLPRECATASFSSVSKSPSLHMSTLSDHVSSSAALAMELDSTLGGTASWNSHVQHPHAQMSEASEIDARSRPRKKWAPAQKIVLATAPQQQHQKDPPKGLKRLLKFGRKSRGSEAATTDWVSASTTSEGDDDTEEPRDLSGRSIDDLLRKARVQAKSFLPGQSAFDFQSLCENAEIEMLLEQGPTQSIRSSIPAPPANFKLREDHLSGGTMLKAPRPFFSLPSFRSKGSDSKPR